MREVNENSETGVEHLASRYGALAIGLGLVTLVAIQRGMVVGHLWHFVTVMALWCTGTAAMLHLSYASNDYACFGKEETGHVPFLYTLAFLPYLIPLTLRQLGLTGFGRKAPWNKLCDGIWIGRRPSNPKRFPEGIAVCVDLAAEFPSSAFIRSWSGRYVSFPILEASVRSVDDLAMCIDSLPADGLYIHCAQGHGRTGFFACAFLLRRGIVKTLPQAEAMVVQARPDVKLRRAQREFLLAHEAEILAVGNRG